MPAEKDYIGICIDRSDPIPRVIAVRDGHKLGRDAIMELTDDIRFAMMLLTAERED